MNVTVTVESRLIRTPDGMVWTQFAPTYGTWQRYLAVFDRVRVVARVLDQPVAPGGAAPVNGEGVEVCAVPHYVGPLEYVRHRMAITQSLQATATTTDAVILRMPSPIGALVASARTRHRLPYAVEVIGDPYDVFAPGVDRHPLRPLLRHHFAHSLRRHCRSAVAVAYETERALQNRYPAGPDAPSLAVSSVDLPGSAFTAPRHESDFATPPTLVSIGTLERLYKGVDTLIDAVGLLTRAGFPVRVVHVGTGRYRAHLEHLAVRRGIIDRFTFAGWVPTTEGLQARLDAADLFVMPSRTEGLPRALLEAMARGLPAIASAVGGIPELLPADDLVPPNDPPRLAEAIRRMVSDPARMALSSARNVTRARCYSARSLEPRRETFYQAVRQATSRGLARGAAR
ncbi:glycosyltransferase [Micromonospora humi]|uniref:Glycosyltransferase involved in cell wall bisynthesis n=1 Tax=Micromonospora humi TaxID=745366 RepID=A0A1C5K8A6_9ACTN|nr:glycosyltransferase [Micromonospora humi]SCG78676.1 Glycosyltransferase involved in cell wall bisynthesis [Micromonospora humi]